MDIIQNQSELIWGNIGAQSPPIYGRMITSKGEELCRVLEKLYNTPTSIILPSGMSAISSALHGSIKGDQGNRCVILYDKELYCDTPKVIKHLPSIYQNLLIKEVDMCNEKELFDEVMAHIGTTTKVIIFSESVSNPTGRVFAFGVIPTVKRVIQKNRIPPKMLLTIIDNTWMSAVGCNPLELGADIVVVSLTKYYSASGTIAGAILGQRYVMKNIVDWVFLNGYHVSPYDVGVILQNIVSIKERVTSASMCAQQVIEILIKNGIDVIHPSHPKQTSTGYLKIPPSVFAIKCKSSMDISKQEERDKLFTIFRETCPDITITTSYGGRDTRLCNFPKRISENKLLIRISIGYADQNAGKISHQIITAIKLFEEGSPSSP